MDQSCSAPFLSCKSLKTSLGCIAAIHQERAAGHKAEIISSKPDKRFGDFFRRGEAFQSMAVSQFLALLLIGGTNHQHIHITRAQWPIVLGKAQRISFCLAGKMG
jgi:hypothetical protein